MAREGCPYCGSPNLVLDDARGSLICRDCGAVVEEEMIDEAPEWIPGGQRTPGLKRSYREASTPTAIGKTVSRRVRISRQNRSETLVSYATMMVEARVDAQVRALAHDIRKMIAKGRPPTIIRRKTSIALALYVILRAKGLSKRQAFREASRRTLTKQGRLEELEREYRYQLDSLIDRVRKEWLRKRETM